MRASSRVIMPFLLTVPNCANFFAALEMWQDQQHPLIQELVMRDTQNGLFILLDDTPGAHILALQNGTAEDTLHAMFCPPAGLSMNDFTLEVESSSLDILQPDEDMDWVPVVAELNEYTGLTCYNMSAEIIFTRLVGEVNLTIRLSGLDATAPEFEIQSVYSIYGLVLVDAQPNDIVSGTNHVYEIPYYDSEPNSTSHQLSMHAYFPGLPAEVLIRELLVTETTNSHIFPAASSACLNEQIVETRSELNTECPWTLIVDEASMLLQPAPFRSGLASLIFVWDRENQLDEEYTTVLNIWVHGSPPPIVTLIEPSGDFEASGGDVISVRMFNCDNSTARSFWIYTDQNADGIQFAEIPLSYQENELDGSQQVFFETAPGNGSMVSWNLSCEFPDRASALAGSQLASPFIFRYANETICLDPVTLELRDDWSIERKTRNGVIVKRRQLVSGTVPSSTRNFFLDDETNVIHGAAIEIEPYGCLRKVASDRFLWSPCQSAMFALLVRSRVGIPVCTWNLTSQVHGNVWEFQAPDASLVALHRADLELAQKVVGVVTCEDNANLPTFWKESVRFSLEQDSSFVAHLRISPSTSLVFVDRPLRLVATLELASGLPRCLKQAKLKWTIQQSDGSTFSLNSTTMRAPQERLYKNGTLQDGWEAFFPAHSLALGEASVQVAAELEFCNAPARQAIVKTEARTYFRVIHAPIAMTRRNLAVKSTLSMSLHATEGQEGLIVLANHSLGASTAFAVFFYLVASSGQERSVCVNHCLGDSVAHIQTWDSHWAVLRCQVVDRVSGRVWAEDEIELGNPLKMESPSPVLGAVSVEHALWGSETINWKSRVEAFFQDRIVSGADFGSILSVAETRPGVTADDIRLLAKFLLERLVTGDTHAGNVEMRVLAFFPGTAEWVRLEDHLGSSRVRLTNIEFFQASAATFRLLLEMLIQIEERPCGQVDEYEFLLESGAYASRAALLSIGRHCVNTSSASSTAVARAMDVSHTRVRIESERVSAAGEGIMFAQLELCVHAARRCGLFQLLDKVRALYDIWIEATMCDPHTGCQLWLHEASTGLKVLSSPTNNGLAVQGQERGFLVASFRANMSTLLNERFSLCAVLIDGPPGDFSGSWDVVAPIAVYILISVFFVIICAGIIIVFCLDRGKRLFGSSSEDAEQRAGIQKDLVGRNDVTYDEHGRAAVLRTSSLRFGVCADVQFASKKEDKLKDGRRLAYREALDRLQVAVQAWKEQNVDFCVQLGNIIDGYDGDPATSAQDLNTAAQQFSGMRVEHVLGNHDRYAHMREIRSLLPCDRSDQYYYSFEPLPTWRFIVLNGCELLLTATDIADEDRASLVAEMQQPQYAESPALERQNQRPAAVIS